MSAQTRSEISDLLRRHGLAPAHRLGQHFLADANITRKIVSTAEVGPGSQVVEVGAGTGTLTVALASAGAHVVAYEIDGGLRPVLEEVTAGLDVELRFEDAMRADLEKDLGEGDWSMVANLPYNVGTPLILDALRSAPRIATFVVMLQREVAQRLFASPGTANYGLPSVVAGLYARGSVAFSVPPQVFLPAPRVGSAVAVLHRVDPAPDAERAIELASAAFGQRRKMLRKSLDEVFQDSISALAACGIDPTRRAEDLTPEDYLRLARA